MNYKWQTSAMLKCEIKSKVGAVELPAFLPTGRITKFKASLGNRVLKYCKDIWVKKFTYAVGIIVISLHWNIVFVTIRKTNHNCIQQTLGCQVLEAFVHALEDVSWSLTAALCKRAAVLNPHSTDGEIDLLSS